MTSSEKNAGRILGNHSITVCWYLAGNADSRSAGSLVPFTDKTIHDMRMNEVSWKSAASDPLHEFHSSRQSQSSSGILSACNRL